MSSVRVTGSSGTPAVELARPAQVETARAVAPAAAAPRALALSHDQASEQRARDWVARKTERLENFENGRRPSSAGSKRRSARHTVDGQSAEAAFQELGALEETAYSALRPADTAAWGAIRVAHEHAAEFEEHAREILRSVVLD